MERRGEFAAAGLQTQSYLEREHNVRRAVLGVALVSSKRRGPRSSSRIHFWRSPRWVRS